MDKKKRIVGAAGALWLGALVLTGCDSGSATTDWRFEEHRVGDTVSVTTLSGQVWPQGVRPVIDLSIGVLDGDEALMLGSITRMAEDPSGGIYVLDEQGPIIRHFDGDGVYVGSVGRGGEGPGEYGSMSLGMVVDVTGVLHVSDWGNGRIARFSAEGDPLDPWRIDAPFLTTVPGRWVFSDGPGRVLLRAALDGQPSLLVLEDGRIVDTLRVPRLPGVPELRGGPYRVEQYWGFHPDGHFVVAVSAEYSFEVHGPSEVVRISRVTEAVPVHAPEAAEWRRRFEWMEAEPRANPPAGEWLPSHMPAFRGLQVGDDGRVWIRRNAHPVRSELETPAGGAPPITWRQPHSYDVFEANGRFLGVVRFPDDTEPLLFTAGYIWGIRRGDFDEQYVVRMVLAGIE